MGTTRNTHGPPLAPLAWYVRPAMAFGVLILILFGLKLTVPFRLGDRPSAWAARWIIASSPMPATADSEGNVFTGPDKGVEIEGIFPLSWGAVAVTHDARGEGFIEFERGLLTWHSSGGSWGPIQSVAATEPFTATAETLDNYLVEANGIRLQTAQLVRGRTFDPAVQTIVVTFDDGERRDVAVQESRFALVDEAHGAACSAEGRAADGSVLKQVPLDPFVPSHDVDPAQFDCRLSSSR